MQIGFIMEIKFYNEIDDFKIKFVVIIAKHNGKFVLCKHKNRSTFEIPGGHRENCENVFDAAKRELFEETGASLFEIRKICPYSVNGNDGIISTNEESFGMLYYAEIFEFSKDGITKTNYCDTEHFKITKQFLNDPERTLHYLLEK